ncbi:MAG: sulfatase-like hydrolase/transferase [Xenococcus sp. MO_188.B8]|nr:sulfatase-like hydrolase/transferase [Xenococcus sp. MO_188.B8]
MRRNTCKKLEKPTGVITRKLRVLGKFSQWIAILAIASLPSMSSAQQPDAEYLVRQKQFGEQWAKEDQQVRDKLAALEEQYGKKPNIVFILADDIGYTELGTYGGGKVRGFSTPNLDKMAAEGMKFLSFYSEPACTPTRTALLTGRHPVRVGLLGVLFPGTAGMGLVDEEVTVAELLSKAGYSTGMFGKWHLGGEAEHYPTNQGFDEAEWSEGNPPWWGFNPDVKRTDNAGYTNMGGLVWSPAPENFPYDTGGIMRGNKGEKPQMVAPFSLELYNTYDTDVADAVIDFIERKANDEQPFFAYYAGKGNHFWGANPDFMNQPAGTNNSAQMAEHDYNVGRVLEKLKELGIAENTLVVWMSDNGPMYAMHPHGGYSLLRGEKGDTWEGAVRVPGIVWWPETIEAGQDPIDIVQVTDMFTTAASIAGVKKEIPIDRITDGVDQSALLLLGEGKSRRDYIFHYNKDKLEAVRKDQMKFRTEPEKPHHNFYNIYHDPGERHPDEVRYGLWSGPGFKKMIEDHKKMIERFPHRVQNSYQREFDYPFDPEN